MKYETPGGFLMALKSHVSRQARDLGISPQRVQTEIVFERLMARLLVVSPCRWMLKGGVALDFRYIPETRATRDMDLAWHGSEEEAARDLVAAQSIDLGDYFDFAFERKDLSEWTGTRSASYQIDIEVGGHHYASVVVDVGFGDPIAATSDVVVAPGFLLFAEVEPTEIPVLPLPYHVAEKVHAYSRQYASGPSSRPKDLVDLIIISTHASLVAGSLRDALQRTFGARHTHPLPGSLWEPLATGVCRMPSSHAR